MKKVKFYGGKYNFHIPEPSYEKTYMEVIDIDTLGAAEEYDNPCCLNFASHKRPGGGYETVMDFKRPIRTQEEDLFRRSNLPEIMDTPEIRGKYPLKGLCGFYTSGIIVNKDAYLDVCDPFDISLVTVPAVVNPHRNQMALVKGKIERILDIAAQNGHKDLILGAWGCGVFNNDPTVIATYFKEFLDGKFKGIFDNVVFAIPGVGSRNHQEFLSVIND